MSRNYDNWERLVAAVLDREKLRNLARAPSLSSSFSSITSDFSLDYSLSNLSVHYVELNGARSSNGPPPSDKLLAESNLVPQDPIPRRWSGEIVTPNLKVFTLAELKSATGNFRPETLLGEGRFGTVFKGYIDEKTYGPSEVGLGLPVAVKKLHPNIEVDRWYWQAEIKFLGKFSHPNLIKLLGYCLDDQQVLLVYEFMPRGSLAGHLFRKCVVKTISWDTRIKIAIGAAQALAFLNNTEEEFIYSDFKSNILLDWGFNAKLSDFRIGKCGIAPAPEYIRAGHLYVESEVYGFGVVLLEIITGLQVFDPNRPMGRTNLVDWVKTSFPDKREVRKLIDPRLLGQYPPKAAYQVAKLILSCLKPDRKNRPNMNEVSDILEQISIIRTKPKYRISNIKEQMLSGVISGF